MTVVADGSFEDAGTWLESLKPRGIQLGLARIRNALQRIGKPDDSFKVVTIAGTNGKGSTAKFLRSILHAAGHRVLEAWWPRQAEMREEKKQRRAERRANAESKLQAAKGWAASSTFALKSKSKTRFSKPQRSLGASTFL